MPGRKGEVGLPHISEPRVGDEQVLRLLGNQGEGTAVGRVQESWGEGLLWSVDFQPHPTLFGFRTSGWRAGA